MGPDNSRIEDHEQQWCKDEEAIRYLLLTTIKEKEIPDSEINAAVNRLLKALKNEKPFPK